MQQESQIRRFINRINTPRVALPLAGGALAFCLLGTSMWWLSQSRGSPTDEQPSDPTQDLALLGGGGGGGAETPTPTQAQIPEPSATPNYDPNTSELGCWDFNEGRDSRVNYYADGEVSLYSDAPANAQVYCDDGNWDVSHWYYDQSGNIILYHVTVPAPSRPTPVTTPSSSGAVDAQQSLAHVLFDGAIQASRARSLLATPALT